MKNNMKKTFAGLAAVAVMATGISGGAVFAATSETPGSTQQFQGNRYGYGQ